MVDALSPKTMHVMAGPIEEEIGSVIFVDNGSTHNVMDISITSKRNLYFQK